MTAAPRPDPPTQPPPPTQARNLRATPPPTKPVGMPPLTNRMPMSTAVPNCMTWNSCMLPMFLMGSSSFFTPVLYALAVPTIPSGLFRPGQMRPSTSSCSLNITP